MSNLSERVTSIHSFTPEQFERWLKEGLSESIQGTSVLKRYYPLHDVIIPTRPVADQLEEIYNVLPTKVQESFAKGLSQAIDSVITDEDQSELCTQLRLINTLIDLR